jgi:hypothetical protein
MVRPALGSGDRREGTCHTTPKRKKKQMEKTSTLKALANYFNVGENKKPLREFAAEVKALSDEEKAELGELAAAAMGQTIG